MTRLELVGTDICKSCKQRAPMYEARVTPAQILRNALLFVALPGGVASAIVGVAEPGGAAVQLAYVGAAVCALGFFWWLAFGKPDTAGRFCGSCWGPTY